MTTVPVRIQGPERPLTGRNSRTVALQLVLGEGRSELVLEVAFNETGRLALLGERQFRLFAFLRLFGGGLGRSLCGRGIFRQLGAQGRTLVLLHSSRFTRDFGGLSLLFVGFAGGGFGDRVARLQLRRK
jgi:hypothetical protein